MTIPTVPYVPQAGDIIHVHHPAHGDQPAAGETLLITHGRRHTLRLVLLHAQDTTGLQPDPHLGYSGIGTTGPIDPAPDPAADVLADLRHAHPAHHITVVRHGLPLHPEVISR